MYYVSVYIYILGAAHSCECIRKYVYIYIPRTQLTSIFEGQPSKTRPFAIKTRVMRFLVIYIYIMFWMLFN